MIDFAWVYWTRQRVKLRHGGVVDSDDLSRGWLISRLVGRKSGDFDEEEAPARAQNDDGRPKNAWGRRGISVSADEGVLEHEAPRRKTPANGSTAPEAQPLADPDAFEDESDDEGLPPSASHSANKHESGVSSGDEWRDDSSDDGK